MEFYRFIRQRCHTVHMWYAFVCNVVGYMCMVSMRSEPEEVARLPDETCYILQPPGVSLPILYRSTGTEVQIHCGPIITLNIYTTHQHVCANCQKNIKNA